MVKGVSKTVIVVNNTGSKLFEKIVFYVTPEYGTLSAKQLRRAASNFTFHFDDSMPNGNLRKRHRRNKLIRNILLICSALISIGAIALLIIL